MNFTEKKFYKNNYCIRIACFFCFLLISIMLLEPKPVFAATFVFDDTGSISKETKEYISSVNENILSKYPNSPKLYFEFIDEVPDNQSLESYIRDRFSSLNNETDNGNYNILFVLSVKDNKYGTYIGNELSNSKYKQDILDSFYSFHVRFPLDRDNYDEAIKEMTKDIMAILENIMKEETSNEKTDTELIYGFKNGSYVSDLSDVISEEVEEYVYSVNRNILSNYQNSPEIYFEFVNDRPEGQILGKYIENRFAELSNESENGEYKILFVFSINDRKYGAYIGNALSDSNYNQDLLDSIYSIQNKTYLSMGNYDNSIEYMTKAYLRIFEEMEEAKYTYSEKQIFEQETPHNKNIIDIKEITGILFIFGCFIGITLGIYKLFRYGIIQSCISFYNDYFEVMEVPRVELANYFMKKLKNVSVKNLILNFPTYMYERYVSINLEHLIFDGIIPEYRTYYEEAFKKINTRTDFLNTDLIDRKVIVKCVNREIDKKQSQSKIRRLERERDKYYDRALKAEKIISDYETFKYYTNTKIVSIEPLGHDYHDGVCSRCGDKQETVPEHKNPFVDVSEDDYYYDAVLWAYENGITSGKDDTHFEPSSSCTRAQSVTFLWRAYGEPEPATKENPFLDVNSSQYYYKAVLWAYENGITSGKDQTHFLPNDTVTRKEFVTFLWRSAEKPEPEITENPFVDVPNDVYYTKAVFWAYENGITTGKDASHFQPDATCIRAQVVSFIYRLFN
ncbi:MAG: S-layer homology domain-containing protein [Lachnospiraceae bacterium]